MAVYFENNYLNNAILAKRDTRKSYNDKIDKLFDRYGLKLIISNPLSEKNLQIADFYSFIVFKYLEHDESKYFDRLKRNILFL